MRWRALKPTRVSDREATCVPSWSGVTWLLELSCYPLWGFWRQRNRPVPVVDLYVGWLKLSTIRRHAPSLAATKTSVMADWLWKETPSLRRSSASSMAIQPQHWNDTPKLLKKTKNRMRHAIKGIQPPSTTPSFTTLPYYKPPFCFLIIPVFFFYKDPSALLVLLRIKWDACRRWKFDVVRPTFPSSFPSQLSQPWRVGCFVERTRHGWIVTSFCRALGERVNVIQAPPLILQPVVFGRCETDQSSILDADCQQVVSLTRVGIHEYSGNDLDISGSHAGNDAHRSNKSRNEWAGAVSGTGHGRKWMFVSDESRTSWNYRSVRRKFMVIISPFTKSSC